MARIRTVKPEFFKHEDLYDAEMDSGLPLRVAFEGLWCQADREGRFEWRPRKLKIEVLPYDEVDFDDVLKALAVGGFILQYEIDGKAYGCIPSFLEHQRPNAHEPESTIPPPQSTCLHMHACATSDNAHAEHNNALREGEGEREREMSTHTNAGASENESPPTTPPSTDDGGSPTTEPKEAKDGPPQQTATRRGVDARALRAWERWNALGLPLPESVPEEDHLAGLTRLFTGGTRTWRLSEVFQAMQRLKDEPDEWEWVTRNGPGYLSHRPRGQPQVIEQVLTRKTRRGSEAGSCGSHHRESVEERVKRIVGAT